MPHILRSSAILLIASLLFALPARAGDLPRVAVLGVSADQTIDARSVGVLEDLLLTALHGTGRFELLGRADVVGLLGFEQQQQALGCDQDASCMAQLASALDVPLVGSASVGHFGKVLIISFKLIDSRAVKVLVRTSVNAASESAVPDAVQRLAEQVANECDKVGCAAYAKKRGKIAAPAAAVGEQPAVEPAPSAPGRALGWVGLLAGVAIAGASVAFDTQAAATHDHQLGAIDFLPVAGYVVAATVGGLGIHRLVSP